jgi:tetratricopeptide (TPR) repeat protein
MTNKKPDLFKFWSELKRRKVIKAGLVYLAIAWAIMEASDTIFPRLGLPEWTVTFVLLLLIIVFILVIVLTWVYDITPEGIKVTESVKEEPVKKKREKQTPEARLADRAGSSETYSLKSHDKSPGEVSGRSERSGSYMFKGFKKLGLPAFILVLIIVVIFFKPKLNQLLGHADPEREIAKTHVENALIYFNRAEYDAARAELGLALESDPGYSYAWSSLAAVNVKQGDLDKALLNTLKAIECDPGNSQAAYNMAYALDDKKDFNQAIYWYKEAIKIDSALKRDSVYVPASSALGRLYNNTGLPTMAIIALNRARKQYPGSRYIYLVHKNLGNAYFLQEQLDSALKYLELAKGVNSQEPETSLFLARTYEAAGQLSKSIELWQDYINLEADTAETARARKHLREITIKHLQTIIE